jgi:hypothetical protein
MSPGYRRPGADSDNSLYPDREPCDIIGVARCDDRKDRDMDQAQLLSLIGSMYDKLVNDVATQVQSQLNLGTVTDIINESIDVRIKAVVEDDFANLFRRVTRLEDRGAEVDMDKLRELVKPLVDSVVDQALSDHCEEYDHDSYDTAVNKLDDVPEDFSEAVKEAVQELNFDIRVKVS